MYRPVLLLLTVFCLPGMVQGALAAWETGQRGGFAGCRGERVHIIRDNDGTDAVTLAHNEYDSGSHELLLNFNRMAGGVFPVAGLARVAVQQVLLDTARPGLGRGSALFLWPSHFIDLAPREGSLFLENMDIGSFTFEFRIHPFANHDGETVFSRYGPFTVAAGTTLFGGVRAAFYGGKMRWEFSNFFRDSSGQYRSLVLAARSLSHNRVWQHQAVTYDHFTGKLTVWVNGVEENSLWATENSSFGGTPLLAAFHRNLRIWPRLGGGFQGKLDAFRVSRSALGSFNINRYTRERGRVLSPVHDMKQTYSKLVSFEARIQEPGGSAVLFEYRIAEEVFTADDSRLPWIRVRNGERAFPWGAHGRYVQWRATLLGAADGRYSPVLQSVRVGYDQAKVLFRPAGLAAAPGDGKVVLRWLPNMDSIEGYRIYVGTRPGEYLERNPIPVPLSALDPKRPEFVVYGLENDRLYYFAVTAYDGKGIGHESPFSREVYARPSFLYSRTP